MAAKLSVIFFILLCLEVGLVLTLFPWFSLFGLPDWSSNYFLLYAAQKTGLHGLQHAVTSGWFRGAVTGLGVLNLCVAGWEIAHFKQTVRALQTGTNLPPQQPPQNNVASTAATPDQLPDNERGDYNQQ